MRLDRGALDTCPGGTVKRDDLLLFLACCFVVAAALIVAIALLSDGGPVCGTGQDKGPC